jgi:hypothetical protein
LKGLDYLHNVMVGVGEGDAGGAKGTRRRAIQAEMVRLLRRLLRRLLLLLLLLLLLMMMMMMR